MHPYGYEKLASAHRHELEAAAAAAHAAARAARPARRSEVGRYRTAAGLTLVRVGLRLSQPLTPAMLAGGGDRREA